jgi:hypothetical protein
MQANMEMQTIKVDFGRGEFGKNILILARTEKSNLLIESFRACNQGSKGIRDGTLDGF